MKRPKASTSAQGILADAGPRAPVTSRGHPPPDLIPSVAAISTCLELKDGNRSQYSESNTSGALATIQMAFYL